jgi:DNA modification methylase
VRLTHLSEAQKKVLMLADNRLAEESMWDPAKLRVIIKDLVEVDFDLDLTGFDTPEIDFCIDGPVAAASDPADDFEEPAADQPSVSRPGELWRLGRHRLLCGSALDPASYEALLGDERAHMVFTDPPYNVPVRGHVSGLGRVHHREFAMASGEMSPEAFAAFLATTIDQLVRFTTDGSLHFVCMDWRSIDTLVAAGRQRYAELKNICVWDKGTGGMGSLYRSQHELVAVFKNGAGPHLNNVELGKHGRYRTNVWAYPGANSFSRTRASDLEAHPTVKPIGLVADAILDCTKRGQRVLDPFVGSGATILAAERTGRRAAAIEIDPVYVDTAIRRWEAKTGEQAVLEGDGRTLSEVAAERLRASDEIAPEPEAA